MLHLDDFNLPPRVKKIFLDQSWVFGEALVLNLELYKFVSREEICSAFNKAKQDVQDILFRQNRMDIPDKEPSFLEVEREFDVIIETVDRETVRVITSIYNPKYDPTMINLRLKVTHIKSVYVTPVNYLELAEKPLPRYDELILLKRIVLDALQKGATDIHFSVRHTENGDVDYYTRYRLGSLVQDQNLFKFDKSLNRSFVERIAQDLTTQASSLDLDHIRGVESGILNLFGDGLVSLRMSANKILSGYHCVFRVIEYSMTSKKVGELGFAEEIVNDLRRTSRKKRGATFITGAPRTGKNTTAQAILNEMESYGVEIQEYGSPIENFNRWTQVDYNGNTEHLISLITLSRKQDTNVTLVTEIPSKSVGKAVGTLVNANMHVVTTFHMDRLWHLPYKLYEYYEGDFKNILSQVNICVNQKMYGVQCPHCLEAVAAMDTKGVNPAVDFYVKKGYLIYNKPKGCSVCKGTGFTTKVQPFVERLFFTEDLVSELLSLKEPYEMERVLRKRVEDSKQSLEYYMLPAVLKGQIPISALEDLL